MGGSVISSGKVLASIGWTNGVRTIWRDVLSRKSYLGIVRHSGISRAIFKPCYLGTLKIDKKLGAC